MLPHFHAFYGEYEGQYGIDPLGRLAGAMPKKIDGKIIDWAGTRQWPLLEDWDLAKAQKPLKQIP
jgi:hypothetical protein